MKAMTENEFISSNYLTMPVKTMAAELGRSGCFVAGRMRKLGLVVPKHVAESRRLASQFKSGHFSFNKGKKQSEYMSDDAIERTKVTRFRKGNLPSNTKFDGYERVTIDGYVEMRIRKAKFVLKHRWEWEQVNGAIPTDYILVCKTSDRLNTSPSNWELITRAEHAIRNSSHDNPSDNRIARYIATTSRAVDKELQRELLNHPDLLEAKRNQLKLNRKIKNHGTKQNDRPEQSPLCSTRAPR